MPSTAFSIRFRSDDIHRIRNFGEDLARAMREQRLGSVGDIDSAIDEISGALASPASSENGGSWFARCPRGALWPSSRQ